jgi:hypothetical protein
MSTFNKILFGILIGLLIAVSAGWFIQSCSYKKENTDLKNQLYSCQHAKVQIHDSIRDSVVYITKWLKPKPIPYPVHDTTYIDTAKPKFCEQYYNDSIVILKDKLRGVVKYKAISKDCGLWINPYETHFPIDYRIEIKTVLHDTNLYKPVIHYGVLVGASINNLKSFPSFQAGVFLSLYDKLILEPGILYNPVDGHAYFNAILGINLDKH